MSERQRVMPADNPMPSSTPVAPPSPPPSLTTTPTQPRTPAPTPTPVVTTPRRMGMEDPAVAHDAPHADHHAAPADVSINAVVGEKVILNGSVYDMGICLHHSTDGRWCRHRK